MKNKNVIIFTNCILILILTSCLPVLGCINRDDTIPSPDLADLKIAGINVMPQIEWHPVFVAEEFGLNVTVRNIGTKSSGSYNVKLHIEEVSSGLIYPIGTFSKDPMPPGEIHTVYSSIDRVVNNPGIHRVKVEIIPIGWEDADPSNNTGSLDFDVVLL